MRRAVFFCCLAVATGTSVWSTPVDSAIIAAMKVGEVGNYQWIATVEEDNRFYVIEGKTRQDGYALVNMPMVNSLQRKLGGGRSEIQTAIFKGSEHFVVQTPDSWKSREELAASPSSNSGRRAAPGGSPRPIGPGSGTFGPGRAGLRYSNLQVNLSYPHDELETIVGSYTRILPNPTGVEGTLSEDGAKILLVHPGQNEITALRASGTFKLWLKEGAVVKYEVELTGALAIGVGSNRREVSVHQTVTTELKSVGATKFEIPEEAKRKLG